MTHPLIRQALTHRSASRLHNERLEFLGDAVLGMLIAETLYQRLQNFSEGGLSRVRAYLVQKSTLATVAQEIGLATLLHVGKGETKSCGCQNASMLADAFEAIIGAVYLLEGKQATQEFVQRIFASRLQELPAVEQIKDAKSRLQEALQARGLPLPAYQKVAETQSVIRVVCTVAAGNIQTTAKALSKREAEQQAAAAALEQFLADDKI